MITIAGFLESSAPKMKNTPFKSLPNHLHVSKLNIQHNSDQSLARPERKQATATEDFEFHVSYL